MEIYDETRTDPYGGQYFEEFSKLFWLIRGLEYAELSQMLLCQLLHYRQRDK